MAAVRRACRDRASSRRRRTHLEICGIGKRGAQPNAVATIVLMPIATVTIPPGDPGSGPHRHSGPVFGYVLEGEILFELEGERPYPIKAGEAFWEPGFEVVHYQAANLRTDIASKFVVFMLCAPDVPMMTYLDEAEIEERAHLRC
jgi:quercetin dioxygenase-like cupin family protein